MVKKIALLTGLFLMISLLALAIPHSFVQEAKAQDWGTFWGSLTGAETTPPNPADYGWTDGDGDDVVDPGEYDEEAYQADLAAYKAAQEAAGVVKKQRVGSPGVTPGEFDPNAPAAPGEAVRTTTAWHLAERFYNTVVYYAFFAPVEVIRNVLGGIGRLFFGV